MAAQRFAPPRTSHYMCSSEAPLMMSQGTWIEAESLCYPGGGMHRRARAICPDGQPRIIRCGIPDTLFSIPAKGGGWIGFDNGVVRFHPPQETRK
jgi:hypothetical protein